MYYIIVNESSRNGQGRELWLNIKETLDRKSVDYISYLTEYKGHATKLAAEISTKGSPEAPVRLIVVGGDGTINEVLNGLDFDRVQLGILGNGSGNDFVRGAGIPEDRALALETILEHPTNRRMDLGRVSWNQGKKNRIFGISAGVGLDAIVCKKADHSKMKGILNAFHLGKLTYGMLTLLTIFSMRYVNTRIRCDKTPVTDKKKMIYAAAMNLRAEGGGVPMAPEAILDDGKLTLCAASNIPKPIAFGIFPFLLAGKHAKLKSFDVRTFETMRLHMEAPMTLHADGEYCGEVSDLVFEVLPQQLCLLD